MPLKRIKVIDKDLEIVYQMTWQHHAGRNIPFSFIWPHLEGYMVLYPKFIGLKFKSIVAEGRGEDFIMWRDKKDLALLRKKLKKLAEDKNFVIRAFNKMKKVFRDYKKYADYVKNLDVGKLNDQEIAETLNKYYCYWQIGASGVSTLIELTTSYGQIIWEKMKNPKEEDLSLLSSPISRTTPLKEEIDFLKLLIKIKKNTNSFIAKKLIQSHFDKYCWLSVYMGNPKWKKDEFIKRIKDSLKTVNPKKKLEELLKKHKEDENRIKAIIKKNQLNFGEVELLREMIFYRIEYENLFSYATYSSFDLRKRIAKKLNLDLDNLNYLKPEETSGKLKGKEEWGKDLKSLIKARKKHYVIVIGKNKRHDFIGEEADLFLQSLKKDVVEESIGAKDVKGTVASPGIVKGKVRVVTKIEEIGEVKNGEILVTYNTTPTFLPAMKKAAAIVTDEGGITCHAAIVSRELGIPCIIGTKIATKVLKDGQLVEVDANKGVVRILKSK